MPALEERKRLPDMREPRPPRLKDEERIPEDGRRGNRPWRQEKRREIAQHPAPRPCGVGKKTFHKFPQAGRLVETRNLLQRNLTGEIESNVLIRCRKRSWDWTAIVLPEELRECRAGCRGDMKDVVERWSPKVKVEENNILTCFMERQRKICNNRALPFPGDSAGDGERSEGLHTMEKLD